MTVPLLRHVKRGSLAVVPNTRGERHAGGAGECQGGAQGQLLRLTLACSRHRGVRFVCGRRCPVLLPGAAEARRWAPNITPQETKARRTPCSTLSSATPCPPTDQPRPEEPGVPGHRSYPRTPSGLTAHGRCSGPWSVLRLIISAPAPCRCSGPLSVLKPIASASAHCQDPGPLPVPSPLPVLRPIVRTQAHCRDSSALSVLRPIVGTHSPLSGPRPIVGTRRIVSAQCIVGAPAHCRDPHRKPRTGTQHHALLGPTRGCRRRPIASARSSLPLLAAPDPWR